MTQGAIVLELLRLAAFDLLFVGVMIAALVPLAAYKKAAFAVLKRNFVGYFSNPTGYVFLCIFVLLTSIAAFWPHEFFVANLANLDQLNRWIPWIFLIFIPSITMSIWADERRQGTDELLLTLPAADFDIVIGKYLAAASIFTVSLLFSQLANYSVLVSLTLDDTTKDVDLDTGLFFTTYFGYWLMGLAMLALGMVASFLTSNLTVSFILGLAINFIPISLYYADMFVPGSANAQQVSRWSPQAQFDDFGRGVISFASTMYFLLLIALGIYLSMVLIGKRHWQGGRDGQSLWWHYLVRAAALVVVLIGTNMLLERWDVLRQDATEGQVSALSPNTKRLLAELAKADQRPVVVDAYISANMPDEYVKTRYNLVAMLKELKSQSGGRIEVRIHDNLEPFSEAAAQAEERFGIRPQVVRTESRGAFREEQFILGAAFTSGLEKVVVPFFGNGIPVEYELIRSIATVGKGDRKKLGIVQTDANLMGGFSFAGGQPRQISKQLIVDELEKQYKVEEVDATNPIEPGKYDALLVVQPSSLGPQQLSNLVDAIRKGQPAAIFEDPFPMVMSQTVGTADPKPPMGGGMFGGGPPQPKGDIRALWDALGIQPTGDSGGQGDVPATVVWQKYNPYPKFQMGSIGDELVFIRNDAPGAKNAFNPEEPVAAKFEELLFPYPTGITPKSGSKLTFTPLVETSATESGTIPALDLQGTHPSELAEKRGKPTERKYTLAAWIRGEKPAPSKTDDKQEKKSDDKTAKTDDDKAADQTKERPIDVIYVGDIDLLHSEFVQLRNQPNPDIEFRFDNVPFVLNVIDAVAGDNRFLEIRTRKPRHSTLKTVEARAAAARENEADKAAEFRAKYAAEERKADAEAKKTYAEVEKAINELKEKQRKGEVVDPGEFLAKMQQFAFLQEKANRNLEVKKEQLRIEREKSLAEIQRKRDQDIQRIQNEFKVWATFIPPIPPLLVGIAVWIRRRIREREGISRSRMK
jgi:ABC-2 type transport system permease protein